MNYESEFTPLFLKLLAKLDKQIKARVLKALEDVLTDPRSGSQLIFAQQICFKWRVGDYRMIYKIDERRKIVTFVVVDHRRRIYKRHRL
ncbi:MAG: type II toxin-antitoxin system RelE/ParE family toxin [Candidatus Bathyarchaeia archaeon]